MKAKKQGISLIVLVITIIVMIVLAAAIILTLSQNGIIGRANEAVSEMNEAQIQELATIGWSEAYLEDEVSSEAKTNTWYETQVTNYLKANGITEEELAFYDIKASSAGVSVSINKTGEATIIWKATNVSAEFGEHYANTYIKMESVYRKLTLKEYKEKYIANAFVLENGTTLPDGLELEDLVVAGSGCTSLEELAEVMGFTRDEMIYQVLLEVDDEDAALEKYGYNVQEVEEEYNNIVWPEPEEELDKSYTITYPDGTTETVLGSELATVVKKYLITENGNYEIKISDGDSIETFEYNITTIVPMNSEDEYYTYSMNSGGYSLNVKDRSLTQYPDVPERVNGAPIDSVSFISCQNIIVAPKIPNTVTGMAHAFVDCTNLTTAPEIPSSVKQLNYAFSHCTKLQGVLVINSTKLLSGSWGCENMLLGAGTEGSGLTVVVPNDEVRARIIAESGYDSEHVTIVKSLD